MSNRNGCLGKLRKRFNPPWPASAILSTMTACAACNASCKALSAAGDWGSESKISSPTTLAPDLRQIVRESRQQRSGPRPPPVGLKALVINRYHYNFRLSLQRWGQAKERIGDSCLPLANERNHREQEC